MHATIEFLFLMIHFVHALFELILIEQQFIYRMHPFSKQLLINAVNRINALDR